MLQSYAYIAALPSDSHIIYHFPLVSPQILGSSYTLPLPQPYYPYARSLTNASPEALLSLCVKVKLTYRHKLS